jgi:hypothetical protein
MLLGYPISEIALLALWIAGAGILVGILAGLFGIGGGAIIVPVLYEVFRVIGVPEEVRIQTCIGTSLAIIVPTTIRSYLGHKKKGAVLPEVVRIWTLPAIFGVAIGSVTASFAPAPVFKIAFLFFVTFIAIRRVDIDRVVEDLDGQTGCLGCFLRQYNRACAGIEHHRNTCTVDMCGDRKVPAVPAHDLDIASMACDMTGHEFGYDAIGDFA